MLRHYLRTALRRLQREKGYALLNVAGLALGLACAVLLGLWVQDERSFDGRFALADRTFRVVETRETPAEGQKRVGYAAGALAPALEAEAPGVAHATRLAGRWNMGRMTVERGEARFYVGDFLFAEPDFFAVFDFQLRAGDPAAALAAPMSVVLTEAAAAQYFGEADPMGQTLDVEWFDDPVTVTGVVQDPPPDTHLEFSMVFSYVTLRQFEGWWTWSETWESDGFATYVVLEEGAEAAPVAAALAGLYAAHRDPEAEERRAGALQPLSEVHFGSADIEDELNAHEGTRAYLYVFAAIAAFLVLIAAINYMNLATARSLRYAREVGVRKATGAHRGQLVAQFLAESVLIAGVALALALGLVALALPAFNALAGKALSLGGGGGTLAWAAGLVLAVGLAAGSYPALYLSRFRPAAVLRGAFHGGQGAARLRRGLVVAQFGLSVLLIVATLVVRDQLGYIQTKALGFDREHLVVVDINSGDTRGAFEAIKQEFGRAPGVRSVAVSSRVPGEWKDIPQVEVRPAGAPEPVAAYFLGIDGDFLETYAMELAAGRAFDEGRPADSSAVLLNEAAAQLLGEAGRVGSRLRIPAALYGGSHSPLDTPYEVEVVGIVRDFHFQSLHEAVAPMVLGFRNNPVQAIDYFTVRTGGGDLAATLAALAAVHDRFDAGHPFEYNVLDERLADFYEADRRVGRVFGLAAGLAVVVACLGLFGLAAYAAERRTKEVGVRKVLGASVADVVVLLSRDFALLVGVAFAVAAPLAYLAMDRWLGQFAYHAGLGARPFLLAGGLALAVALLTVSVHALRAATADPVRALRSE